MADLAVALADEARRSGLVAVVWQLRRRLTLGQLEELIHARKYGGDLGAITVEELITSQPDEATPVIRDGESVQDAVMRVFRARPQSWLSSGFFTRHMGLARWTAQALLADLAKGGWLVREGKTSGTRYRLGSGHEPVEFVEFVGRVGG